MKRTSFVTRLRFSYTASLLDAARQTLRERLQRSVQSTGNGRIAAPALAQGNARPKPLGSSPLRATR